MAVVASDYRPVTRKLEKYASVLMRAQSAILPPLTYEQL